MIFRRYVSPEEALLGLVKERDDLLDQLDQVQRELRAVWNAIDKLKESIE